MGVNEIESSASWANGYKILPKDEYFSQITKESAKTAPFVRDKIEAFNDIYSLNTKKYIDSKLGKGTFDSIAKEVESDYGVKNDTAMYDRLEAHIFEYYEIRAQQKLKITAKAFADKEYDKGFVRMGPHIIEKKDILSFKKKYHIS